MTKKRLRLSAKKLQEFAESLEFANICNSDSYVDEWNDYREEELFNSKLWVEGKVCTQG